MLGILGYLDMVPPGKLKDYERLPFDPVEREGLLFIRSTQDENVPLLAYLFGVTTPHA
jgi:acetylornithine deacetylase/succinyl-diaminopimelate desuccinylase-like protein